MKIYKVCKVVEGLWDWNVVVFAEDEENALQVVIKDGKKKLDEGIINHSEYREYDSFEPDDVDNVYIAELEVKNGVILQYDNIR